MSRAIRSRRGARRVAVVLDEVAVAGDVQRAVWFGTPRPSSRARSSWPSARRADRAIGAEEVDHRVLAGDGVRFDPSGKGKAMKDWLETNAERDGPSWRCRRSLHRGKPAG